MRIDPQFIHTVDALREGCRLAVFLPDTAWWSLDAVRAAARCHGTIIVTPPFSKDDQFGIACIWPQGEVFQPLCFPAEGDPPCIPGTDVAVFDSPLGKLALCTGADIFQPQYPRLAALKGCTLLVVCFPYREERLLMAGPWSAAQANCLPIALADLRGGQVILPCPMTEDCSGLGKSGYHTEELPRAYREFPVFDSLNAQLYRRYREVLRK